MSAEGREKYFLIEIIFSTSKKCEDSVIPVLILGYDWDKFEVTPIFSS